MLTSCFAIEICFTELFPTSRGSVFCRRYSVLISLTKQRHTSLIIIHQWGSTSQSAIVGECACAATMPTRVEPIIVSATVSPEGGPLSTVLVDDYVGGCPRTTPPSQGRVPSFTSTHDPLVNSVLWSSLVIELYCVTHSTNYRLRRRLTLLLFVFHLFTMFLLKASSVLKSGFCTKITNQNHFI